MFIDCDICDIIKKIINYTPAGENDGTYKGKKDLNKGKTLQTLEKGL